MANEVSLLKSRRQPLHKKDGRRAKTGTNSHRKPATNSHRKRSYEGSIDNEETKIAQAFQEGSPTVRIPVLKMDIESVDTTSPLENPELTESQNISAHALLGEVVVSKEEPATKMPCLVVNSSDSITENSTQKVKKKKSKSGKRDSKSKKKHPKPNTDDSKAERDDTEAKRRHSKSKKKHSKSKRNCNNSKRKEVSCSSDRELRPPQCHHQNERQSHQHVDEANNVLSNLNENCSCQSEMKENSVKSNKMSTKCGLLLDKERADKKKRKKSKKTTLLKLEEVKIEHAYSSISPSKTSSSSKDRSKGKRKTLKLDTLFVKSKKIKLNDIPREMQTNSSCDVGNTEVTVREETKEESMCTKKAGRKEAKLVGSTSRSTGVAGNPAPTRKAKHGNTNSLTVTEF